MLGSTNTTLPLTTSGKQKAVGFKKISTLPSYVREKSSNVPVFRAFCWPYFVPKVVNQLVAAAAARYSEVLLKSKNDTSEALGRNSQSQTR